MFSNFEENETEEDTPKLEFTEFGESDTTKKKKKIKIPEEAKTAGLDIIAYPTNKDLIPQRPAMEAHIIPKHASAVIFNGKANSGKSNLLVNLLTRPEFYGDDEKGKHYFDLIFLFSPTANGGDDLVRFLNIPDKRIFTDLNTETLDNIIKTQSDLLAKKKDLLKTPKILIIFDDCQSDKTFLKSKSFIKCFIQGRHINISSWLCSQSWTRTERVCRLQLNNLFFFPGSGSEMKLLAEEFTPPRMTTKEFYELVNYATAEPYHFLHINMRKHFKERYRKNLKEVLLLNK